MVEFPPLDDYHGGTALRAGEVVQGIPELRLDNVSHERQVQDGRGMQEMNEWKEA